MDRYHIALYIHLLALVVAAGASAVTKLAAGRRARARTVGEMLEWHDTLSSTAALFPVCIATFLITGSFMLYLAPAPLMSRGFVLAGLVGVALLLVSSIVLATGGRRLKRMLEGMAARGLDQPAPALVPPPVVATLPAINSGIALAVTFDMVTKPASLTTALVVLAVGIALGAVSGMRRRGPAPAPALTVAPEGR